MDVASKDLSIELYELLAWRPDTWDTSYWEDEKTGRYLAPKYTLGYLLRQLQLTGHTTVIEYGDWNYPSRVQVWRACFDGVTDFKADTPEDAVAKLCIELHKQGILPKGSKES